MAEMINKQALKKIKQELLQAIAKLDLLLKDDRGCPHDNVQEISTMDGSNKRKFLCMDCGKTIEKEIEYDEELL